MRLKAYPKYKESGIEWLGELPEGWEVTKVKYVANFTVSNVDKKYQEGETPIRLFNYTDVYNNEFLTNDIDLMAASASLEQIRKFNAQNNDVLITKDSEDWRDIARPALVKSSAPDIVCGYHLAIIRPCIKQTVGKFIYRLLQSNLINQQFQIASNGVTRYGLPKSAIGDSLFTVPPLKEQQAIASFLDRETTRIDALIQKKELMIELLKEKRIALITQAVTKGLDPNAKMKDSGIEWLGEVPEHWEMKRIKDLLIPKIGAIKTGPFGSQLLSSEMEESDVKIYNQKSVISNNFEYGENYISFEKFEELRAFQTFPGDFLITTRGTIGRCAILPPNSEQGILHPCLMRLQTNKRVVADRFLEILIEESPIILGQLKLKSNGTTIDVIYQDSLKNVSVLLPPLQEQLAIADFLDMKAGRIDILKHQVEASVNLLREYRSSLIHSAVTGKIDLRENEHGISL